VDAADDANGERHVSEVFQRHGDKEQGDKGRALGERDETKLTKRSQYRMISLPSSPVTTPSLHHVPTICFHRRWCGAGPAFAKATADEPAIGAAREKERR